MKQRNFFGSVDSETPGYAVAVIKDGETVLMKTAGLADLERKMPITAKTAFRLASLSKQFTAMAVMILAEQKKLYFEDKLTDFFSDYPAYGNKVSVRQLLTHTAGIPDHEKPLYSLINREKNIWSYDRSAKYSEPTIYDSLEVLKRQSNPLFPPGRRYKYSDAGYVLLALVIERVSGLPYRKFLKKNIFLSLGMDNSEVYDEKNQSIKFRAYGYRSSSQIKNSKMYYNESGRNEYNTFSKSNFDTTRTYELFDEDSLNFIVGDEGVYSSIDDMVKWSRAWDEEILVSRKSLTEAMTPSRLLSGNLGKAGFSWLFGKVLNRFRVKRFDRPELTTEGPGMTGVIYQDGAWVGFRNIILKIQEQKLTVIILSNRTDLNTERQRISLAYQLGQKFV